jgi:hypothetical protein
VTPRSGGPPDNERRSPGDQTGAPPSSTAARDDDIPSLPRIDVPSHRPWARRGDAHEVEARFQLDRQAWRHRIECARRTAYDARDDVSPRGGWGDVAPVDRCRGRRYWRAGRRYACTPLPFGLTIAELRREANRIVDLGWSRDETRRVLDLGGES